MHIDCNSKCSDNLLRPFVVWRDCTHAQSVRENGNRAKWIRSLRKSAWEEGRGRDVKEGYSGVFARAIETQCYRRTAGRAKLAPARLANIFYHVRRGWRTFWIHFSPWCMHATKRIPCLSREVLMNACATNVLTNSVNQTVLIWDVWTEIHNKSDFFLKF